MLETEQHGGRTVKQPLAFDSLSSPEYFVSQRGVYERARQLRLGYPPKSQ